MTSEPLRIPKPKKEISILSAADIPNGAEILERTYRICSDAADTMMNGIDGEVVEDYILDIANGLRMLSQGMDYSAYINFVGALRKIRKNKF